MPAAVPATIRMVALRLHWSLVQAPAFTPRGILMVVTTIVIPRDIFIGGDMITGIILTDLMLVRCATTDMNTTNGTDITTTIGDIVINFC